MTNQLNRDLFILGNKKPIETELGIVRFLTYTEYLVHISSLTMISMNKLHIYYQYKKMFDSNDKEAMAAVEQIKKESLFSIVNQTNSFKDAYTQTFSMVLDRNNNENIPDSIARIFADEKLFLSMRNLVMEMNLLSESPVSENPEIQEYYEERAMMKQKEAGEQNSSDIISSIVAGTANSFDEVSDMTIVQLYSVYYRVGAFKNYDTSSLFATVSDKIKITGWDTHIDLFAKSELGIKYDEFNKQYGGLFG